MTRPRKHQEKPTRPLHRPKDAGFSLFGVLLAFFILGVALLSFLNLMIASVRTTGLATGVSVASNLAQQEIELLRTYGYDYWYKALEDNDEAPIVQVDTVVSQGGKFVKTTRVSLSALQKGTVQLEVDVGYRDSRGNLHHVYLTSLLAEYE